MLGVVEEASKLAHQNQKAKLFTSAMTELNLMPTSKGEIKGPSSIFTDQAKRMYLELIGNTSLISSYFKLFLPLEFTL